MSFYRRIKRALEHKDNERKSTEEIFSDIYESGKWGGTKDDYSSGGGTTNSRISDAYVQCLSQLSAEWKFGELAAVDLGCGDMRIGQRIAPFFSKYVGVDIVPKLIDQHARNLATESVSFQHLNIIEDDLPDGNICMIRQVLQHLSNEQISKILRKLKKYDYVLITEHLPKSNLKLKQNLDKPHGGDIRLYENSGVYITAPPFNIPASQVSVVLECEGNVLENYNDPWMPGIIQTILYRPNAKTESLS